LTELSGIEGDEVTDEEGSALDELAAEAQKHGLGY